MRTKYKILGSLENKNAKKVKARGESIVLLRLQLHGKQSYHEITKRIRLTGGTHSHVCLIYFFGADNLCLDHSSRALR